MILIVALVSELVDSPEGEVSVWTRELDKDELGALRYMLCAYGIRFAESAESADVIICKDGSAETGKKPTIRIPSPTSPAEAEAMLKGRDGDNITLTIDPLAGAVRRLREVMNPRTSPEYAMFTRLPLRYTWVSPRFRNLLLKGHRPRRDPRNHFSTEVDRRILVDAFSRLGIEVRRKTPPKLVVTHDVDSERGLQIAPQLHDVERDAGVEAIWFIVSDEYPISRRIAKQLTQDSSIGSHDTQHDGRLFSITAKDELVKRLMRSKSKLEEVFETEVDSFRAPLLQFDRKIVSGLETAGYKDDYSLPAWEPFHPTSMGEFGIEACQPFNVGGITEHPLSLLQDHQLFHVLGMNVEQAAKYWINQAKSIRAFDGDAVLLVHPEHGFGRDLRAYRKLLGDLSSVFTP